MGKMDNVMGMSWGHWQDHLCHLLDYLCYYHCHLYLCICHLTVEASGTRGCYEGRRNILSFLASVVRDRACPPQNSFSKGTDLQ
jgi:hypothetical protein